MIPVTSHLFPAVSRRWSWSVANDENIISDQSFSAVGDYNNSTSAFSQLKDNISDHSIESDFEALFNYELDTTSLSNRHPSSPFDFFYPPTQSIFDDWDDSDNYLSDSDESEADIEESDNLDEDDAQYITIFPDSPFYKAPETSSPTVPFIMSKCAPQSLTGFMFSCEALWDGMLYKSDAQLFHETLNEHMPLSDDGISIVIPKSEDALMEACHGLALMIQTPLKENNAKSIPDVLTSFWEDGVNENWDYTSYLLRPLGLCATQLESS